MMKIIFSTFLVIFATNLYCQDKIISGRVFDESGEPLVGVIICQEFSNIDAANCNNTDYEGVFHFLLNPKLEQKLNFSSLGYHSTISENFDSISNPLKIIMSVDTTFYFGNDTINYWKSHHRRQNHKFGLIFSFQADFLPKDFSEFSPLLISHNVDMLNYASGIVGIELGGTYKNYYAGFNWGYSSVNNYDHESLDIEFNTSQYGLHFGYKLLNTKRFLMTPKIATKLIRYRLINYDNDRKIQLQQYLTNKDLDLRLNQLTGFAGLSLSYKMYKRNLLHTDYWTIGFYSGYVFKLNNKPWIYTKRNRLTSDSEINLKNYNIGLHFSFNIE